MSWDKPPCMQITCPWTKHWDIRIPSTSAVPLGLLQMHSVLSIRHGSLGNVQTLANDIGFRASGQSALSAMMAQAGM